MGYFGFLSARLFEFRDFDYSDLRVVGYPYIKTRVPEKNRNTFFKNFLNIIKTCSKYNYILLLISSSFTIFREILAKIPFH